MSTVLTETVNGLDNLPGNHKDAQDGEIVGTDSRENQLTHYVLAERLLQVEYHRIKQSIQEEPTCDTLIYILEGGFRGYHKFSKGELWNEWTECEELFWSLYDARGLPWDIFEEDPAADNTYHSVDV
tara:strand:+ start:217 stop:597 length:381 start_codon:yes stop_codon:yes gene_type:complete